MEKEIDRSTAGDIGAGVVLASFLFSGILLAFAFWAPASYYLGQWSDYWWGDDWRADNTTIDTTRPTIVFDLSNGSSTTATDDCKKRSLQYFGAEKTSSFASATGPEGEYDYTTYDCYAAPYTKIP